MKYLLLVCSFIMMFNISATFAQDNDSDFNSSSDFENYDEGDDVEEVDENEENEYDEFENEEDVEYDEVVE